MSLAEKRQRNRNISEEDTGYLKQVQGFGYEPLWGTPFCHKYQNKGVA